jgi:hypothetical protein
VSGHEVFCRRFTELNPPPPNLEDGNLWAGTTYSEAIWAVGCLTEFNFFPVRVAIDV